MATLRLTNQFSMPITTIGEDILPLLNDMGVEIWREGESVPDDFPGLQEGFTADDTAIEQVSEEIITGISDWQSLYRSLTTEDKKNALLETARLAGFIPAAHDVLLSTSLFGNHGLDFLSLLADAGLPFGNRSIPLNIAVYGAGFFSAADMLRSAGDIAPDEAVSTDVVSFISGIEEELFGETRGTSYEPREILSLFLPGDRPGSLTVYDMDERVKADLAKPTFITTNVADASNDHSPRYVDFLQRYRQMIFSGRNVSTHIGRHAEHMEWRPIAAGQFTFTPEEMLKVRVDERDFVSDGFPATDDDFNFSIWLEGFYFFVGPVQIAILAGIVEHTAIGGYILLDLPVTRIFSNLMGLRPVRIVSTNNAVLSRKKRSLILLQKIRETPFVDKLSRLLRGGR